jgi:hypothetical protein
MGVGDQRHAPAALLLVQKADIHFYEAVWAPGTVWTGPESFIPTGIRSPYRPARSNSHYRLRDPTIFIKTLIIIYAFNNMLYSEMALIYLSPFLFDNLYSMLYMS